MKFGICTGIDNLEFALSAGADYIEVSNAGIMKMTDEQFRDALVIVDRHPGKILACNGLFSPDLRIVGEETDDLHPWIEKSIERLARLGVKNVVFGSGKARNCPEGFSEEKAMEQIVGATRLLSEYAAKADSGMRIVIEPLRVEETNMIHTAADSCNLAKLADRPNVRGHVDFYHFMQNGEKIPDLIPCIPTLAHVHIASPCRRDVPTADDCANYKLFLDTLRKGGYDGAISYEGKKIQSAEQLSTYFNFIRSL